MIQTAAISPESAFSMYFSPEKKRKEKPLTSPNPFANLRSERSKAQRLELQHLAGATGAVRCLKPR